MSTSIPVSPAAPAAAGKWVALPERQGGNYEQKTPRVTFSNSGKGRPRVYFNTGAAARLGLKAGGRVTFFGAKGATVPEIGLAVHAAGTTSVRALKGCRSLQCTTSALEHLTNFRRIVFSPSPVTTFNGGPQWLLKCVDSERKAGV